MKSIVKIIPCLVLTLLLAACGEGGSDNGEKRLVSAIGFDRSGEEIVLVLETVGGTEAGENEAGLLRESGEDIAALMTEIEAGSPETLGFGQLAAVVFGSSLEARDRQSIFEFLKSKSEIPLSARAVAAEKAEELLKSEDEGESAGYGIKSLLNRTEEKLGIAAHSALYEVEAARLQNMNIYSLPKIGEELSFDGMELFSNDSRIKSLDYRESLVYTLLRNLFEGGEVIGEKCVYSISSAKTWVSSEMRDDRLYITVSIKSEPEAGELVSAVREVLSKEARDIFGLGEVICRREPELYKKIEAAYEEYFKNAVITVVGE